MSEPVTKKQKSNEDKNKTNNNAETDPKNAKVFFEVPVLDETGSVFAVKKYETSIEQTVLALHNLYVEKRKRPLVSKEDIESTTEYKNDVMKVRNELLQLIMNLELEVNKQMIKNELPRKVARSSPKIVELRSRIAEKKAELIGWICKLEMLQDVYIKKCRNLYPDKKMCKDITGMECSHALKIEANIGNGFVNVIDAYNDILSMAMTIYTHIAKFEEN